MAGPKSPFSHIDPDAQLLSVNDAARALGFGIMRVYADVKSGELKASRFGKTGRTIRIRREDLAAYIAAHEVTK